MLRRSTLFAVILSLFALAGPGRAEQAPKADKTQDAAPASPKATAANIAQWVRDMDAEELATRERAVAKLAEAGKTAIGPVAAAAKGKSLEASARSVSVLKKLLASEDESTKAAAKAALEELAKDEKHPAGHMAGQALGANKPSGRNMGAVAIGRGRVVIGAARVANVQPAPPQPPAAPGVQEAEIIRAGKKLESALKSIKAVREARGKAAGNDKTNLALDKLIKQVEATLTGLAEIRKGLGK